MIVASYRVECDNPGCQNTGTNSLARGEDSAAWAPKDIRDTAQLVDGFVRKGRADLCPECANTDPTLFDAPAVVDVRSPLSDPPDTTHGEEVA